MKSLKLIILGVVVVIAGGAMFWWYRVGQIHPSTDDAYVHAHVLTIAPQVSGKVVEVPVMPNARVSKGDVLFQIDKAPLQAQVDAAQAQLDQALQAAGASQSNVGVAEAQLKSAQAAQTEAQTTFDRTNALFKKGDVSKATLDQARTALDTATAAVSQAQAAQRAASDQAGAPGDSNAAVRAAQAELTAAQLNLDNATITAPTDGWVADLSLRPGAVVYANQPLFSFVENTEWWVEGNFKETDLDRIRPGQPATISLDMYPGLTLKGKVESIGAGSGAVFSLVPPENASGNWVKVTQRFPIRVSLDALPTNSATQLRVGASTTVTVDTSGLDAK